MKRTIKILLLSTFLFLTNGCMLTYDGWISPNTYDYYHSPYYYFRGYPYYGYPYYGFPYYRYQQNYNYRYNPPKPNNNHRPKPGTHYGPRR